MDNYIVRIYRRDRDDPQKVVGVVEFVEAGTRRTFSGMNDLLSLLCARSAKRAEDKESSERSQTR